ncbi:MAG: hypothetical protein ACLT5P_06965, partial [Flavonifractor plautii]
TTGSRRRQGLLSVNGRRQALSLSLIASVIVVIQIVDEFMFEAFHGFCDTIRFGRVESRHNAFLIQNMFPITREYIQDIYLDRFSHIVRATPSVRNDVIRSAKSVFHKVQSRGLNLTFVDVLKLRSQLLDPERGTSTPSLAAQLAAATARAEAQQAEHQAPVQQRKEPSLDR